MLQENQWRCTAIPSTTSDQSLNRGECLPLISTEPHHVEGGVLLLVTHPAILNTTPGLLQSQASSRKILTSVYSTGQTSSKDNTTGLASEAQASRI